MRVYGENLSTAQATNSSVYQKFVPTDSMILRAIRVSLIQNNDPTYTSASLKIYSNRNGSPGALIATSTNSPTKAQLFSGANSGITDACFIFDDVSLRGGETYHVVVNLAGYTGSDSSHIAWKNTFPSAVYRSTVDTSFTGMHLSPREFAVIGAKL